MQDLINMFNDHELELLISGLPEIDVDDLRGNTEYTGYTPAARQIQWFWEIVAALSKEDLALLVQFVTGTSKVPLEGFKALQVSQSAAPEPQEILVGCVVCKCPSYFACPHLLALCSVMMAESLNHSVHSPTAFALSLLSSCVSIFSVGKASQCI